MARKNKIFFVIHLCLLFLLALSGCRIRMTPKEQLGIKEDQTSLTVESGLAEPNQASIETISKASSHEWEEDGNGYIETGTAPARESGLKRLSAKYIPFQESEVRLALRQLYGAEAEAYHIACFDGGTGLIVSIKSSQGDADLKYADLMNVHLMNDFQNPVGGIHMGDGAKLRKPQLDFFTSLSQGREEGMQDAAEHAVRKFLSAVGYDIAYIDCTFLSTDMIVSLRDEKNSTYSGMGITLENVGIQDWEKEGIYYFSIRQNLGKVLVESFTGESLIEAAYSPAYGRIVLVSTGLPLYQEIFLDEKEVPLLGREEAGLFAEDILKRTIPGDFQVTGSSLVYAHSILGAYNYDEQTVSLWPAWKFSFRTSLEGQEIEDYIMLDAETGNQLTNATPLY